MIFYYEPSEDYGYEFEPTDEEVKEAVAWIIRTLFPELNNHQLFDTLVDEQDIDTSDLDLNEIYNQLDVLDRHSAIDYIIDVLDLTQNQDFIDGCREELKDYFA